MFWDIFSFQFFLILVDQYLVLNYRKLLLHVLPLRNNMNSSRKE